MLPKLLCLMPIRLAGHAPQETVSATVRAALFMLFNTALGSYIVGTITLLVVRFSTCVYVIRMRMCAWAACTAGATVWRSQAALLVRHSLRGRGRARWEARAGSHACL